MKKKNKFIGASPAFPIYKEKSKLTAFGKSIGDYTALPSGPGPVLRPGLGRSEGEMNIAMGIIPRPSLDVCFRIQAPPSLSPPATAGIRGKGRE